MVRHVLQDRSGHLIAGLRRRVRRLRPLAVVLDWTAGVLRQVLTWLLARLHGLAMALRTARQVTGLLVRPRNPNNVFTVAEAGLDVPEAAPLLPDAPVYPGPRRSTLLFASTGTDAPLGPQAAEAALIPTLTLSLLSGLARADGAAAAKAAAAVNHRFSYADLLAKDLRRLSTPDIADLSAVIQRLTKRWLDMNKEFAPVERRNRLDVQRTLRHNIQRYGGFVLDFMPKTKILPVAKLTKPARLVVIGDVSHSMVHYASVVLYFFHLLNVHFQVDSYVFSNRATRATPYLNGPGTFTEKVRDLVANAASWNAGTRFGSSLEQILDEAHVDRFTHVVIATDGKVALGGGEYERVHANLARLRRLAHSIVFLTPEASFAAGHGAANTPVAPVGAFRSGHVEFPIFDLNQLWYGILGKYADRVYWTQSVQDLIDMCEDLYRVARD